MAMGVNSQKSDRIIIEEVIENTFKAIQDAYNYQKESNPRLNDLNRQKLSRIVFPQKRDGSTRISEQELRCVFVEQLNRKIKEGWNVYYSVETPTNGTYSGFSNGGIPKPDDNGRSGEFDLAIFNNQLKRIALIEFKANNASLFDHKKDFVKLNDSEEGIEDIFRFFIEIIKSFDKKTLLNLQYKIKGNESMYRCWSLKEGRDITEDIINAL